MSDSRLTRHHREKHRQRQLDELQRAVEEGTLAIRFATEDERAVTRAEAERPRADLAVKGVRR